MKRVFVYLTGHGFGHVGRSSAVLLALKNLVQKQSTVELHVRTSARALGFARALSFVDTVAEVDVGPGLVQRGPLAVDHLGSLEALAAHAAAWPGTIARELRAMQERGVDLVYADIPSIAFAIAAEAGVPSVGLGNFSWSWMYRELEYEHPGYRPFAELCAGAEAQATELLRLEVSGGLDHFPRARTIPPVARRAGRGRLEVRRALGLDPADARPVVLVSFGGFGDTLDLGTLAAQNHEYRFLLVEKARGTHPRDVVVVERSDDLPHPDLVAASDCVLSKPGYGTYGECLAAAVPLVYVAHRHLPEYEVMVETIRRGLRSAALPLGDFEEGRWSQAIAAALSSQAPVTATRADGDAEAAAVLARYLGYSQMSLT